MKTKIVLLVLGLVFFGVATKEWRSLSSAMVGEDRAIQMYVHLTAKEEAQPDGKVHPWRGFLGNHQVIVYRIEREQQFIVWSVLFTFPLVVYLAATLKRKEPNQ